MTGYIDWETRIGHILKPFVDKMTYPQLISTHKKRLFRKTVIEPKKSIELLIAPRNEKVRLEIEGDEE